MMTAQRMVDELSTEAELTRRVLERIPEEHLSWRPHPKSMSLGQLGLHIAELPRGITELVTELDVEVPPVPLPEARTRAQVLETFETGVRIAVEKLERWGNEGLDAEWRLRAGDAVLSVQRRGEVLRTLLLNQLVHHRGQLTVYLRLLNVPLPPIYGPSADESPAVPIARMPGEIS